MKNIIMAGALILCLAGCANNQATKNAVMATPGFMNKSQTIERQRPRLPVTHYIRWHEGDRLLHGVELDYISGMSQRDYLFEQPTQQLFRPMINDALLSSGLQAQTPTSARYALQIEFHDVDSATFGRHLAGKTSATYRLVDRATGAPVYENVIRSNFIAEFPGMNEEDASRAYDISAPGVIAATKGFAAFSIYEAGLVEVWNNNQKLQNFFGGSPVTEISQSDWNNVYQAYAWVAGISAISGPALVLWQQVNPANYVALQTLPRAEAPIGARAARQGNLSVTGQGERNARTRAQQLSTHLLAQSFTYFMIDLAANENVPPTKMVPCAGGQSSADDLVMAVQSRTRLVSDNCVHYTTPDTSRGVGLTSYR